ncbi:MAG: helix-turn-helix transcriptional regulator [Clostridia bacterium]|nr:helix-turn-helix transcriptional regulator [Clostridia bacterium]
MKIYDFNGRKNLCGRRIHEARAIQRMSQSTLAAKLQLEGIIIERDSISRIEIGTRFVPDYELPIFAKILGVSIPWLLELE